jgi:hypothetical protein
MVTHSLGTVRGLKILVSAVQSRPWPHFSLLYFNALQKHESPLIAHFQVYFAITLLVPSGLAHCFGKGTLTAPLTLPLGIKI